MERICPKCGAIYDLGEVKTIQRDRDSLECNFCNTTIMKWNGASFWVIKKVLKEPEKFE